MNKVNFGKAVEAMKNGKKAYRQGWNGSKMFLVISPGAEQLPSDKFFNKDLGEHAVRLGGFMDVRPAFMLKTAQDDVAYWSPSGSDALAEDWVIVDETFLDRLKIENNDLVDKINKLKDALENKKVPASEIDILEHQLDIMRTYRDVLLTRIDKAGGFDKQT